MGEITPYPTGPHNIEKLENLQEATQARGFARHAGRKKEGLIDETTDSFTTIARFIMTMSHLSCQFLRGAFLGRYSAARLSPSKYDSEGSVAVGLVVYANPWVQSVDELQLP